MKTKIRTAVIGAGYLGRFHAEKYSKLENVELVGVVDIHPERAREVAAACGTKAFGSHQELFGLVDAVSVVTPTESHCAIGLDFLSRGTSVLMEKPIALNVEEADSLIKEARRAGAVLQVGHLERFNGAITALEGRVKDPSYIECRRLSPFPGRSTDVDVVMDVMIHDIDIILHLVNSEIESVEAAGMPVITPMADVMNARIRFKNGTVASITSNRACHEKVRKLEVFQKDAVYRVDFMAQSLTASKIIPGKDGEYATLNEEVLSDEKRDSLMEELRSFVNASASKKTPLVTGEDGKRALEVAGMIQEAYKRSSTHPHPLKG